jgi:amino acid transporter
LGHFSKRLGTPIVMNLLSGVVATVLMVLAFTLTGGNADRYFTAVLGLTISTTTISYLFIFPALVRLRYKYPDVERPYRVPGGAAMAWVVSGLTTFWALLATVALIWPGFGVNWFGQHANPNDALDALSFSHERLQYELSQIVPLIVLIAVGVIFYLLGATTRDQTVDVAAGSGTGPLEGGAAGAER